MSRGAVRVPFRAWALGSAALLSLTYLQVLGRVVDVAGDAAGVALLAAEVVVAVGLAAWLSRSLPVRWALAIGGGLLAAGLLGYVVAIPGALGDLGRQVSDTIALVSGLSVLRMTKVELWALGFAPAPVFVSWYLFLRRAYAPGVLAGGAALSFFVLTGDAGTMLALAGAVGAIGAVGFGRLDHVGGTAVQRDRIVTVAVAALVVTTSVSLVPGGEARTLLPGAGKPTVEASLVGVDGELSIPGSVRLSTERRLTVTADRPARWRTDAFDRYTGDSWVRTGETRPGDGLPPPPADDVDRFRQQVEVESAIGAVPAAWKPVAVSGVDAAVTGTGGLEASLDAGDRYTVESVVPAPSPAALRSGGEYPDRIEERYLQLPASTPDRVGELAARIADGAPSDYDAAVRIERWLEANKEYSLSVRRPEGDVAAGFLFRMEAGYCTYFATAMVAMLRTQGIPSRLAVGYTPGEQVGEDTWAVRGLDAHAWVEVYVPDVGWVAFDPTPAGPRLGAERERLTDEGAGSGGFTPFQTRTANPNGSGGIAGTPATPTVGSGIEAGGPGRTGGDPALPSRDTLLYGAILLAGAATAVHRTRLHERLYRAAWLRRPPAGPPAARIEATVDRAEYVLGRRHRPRRADETLREYLRAVGERDDRLLRAYERARYAGAATEADAEVAREALRELRREGGPLR